MISIFELRCVFIFEERGSVDLWIYGGDLGQRKEKEFGGSEQFLMLQPVDVLTNCPQNELHDANCSATGEFWGFSKQNLISCDGF